MLIAISNNGILTEGPYSTYYYTLVDEKFSKKFHFTIINKIDNTVEVCDEILNFIYYEYKFSKECPFRNIDYYHIYLCRDPILFKKTKFYSKHKVNLDRLLFPSPYLSSIYINSTSASTIPYTVSTTATNNTNYGWFGGTNGWLYL